jgi:hypothetical protein
VLFRDDMLYVEYQEGIIELVSLAVLAPLAGSAAHCFLRGGVHQEPFFKRAWALA